MDNLGDWLYIVILIAIGISSLFTSGKKKKRPTEVLGQPDYESTVEEQTAEPKSFWDIFDEEKQKHQTQPAPPPLPSTPSAYTEKKKKAQNKNSVSIPSDYFTDKKTVKSSTFDQSVNLMEASDAYSFDISGDSFQNVDELKRAIIYSEILNRKY